MLQPWRDVNTHNFLSSSPPMLIYSPVWFVCQTKWEIRHYDWSDCLSIKLPMQIWLLSQTRQLQKCKGLYDWWVELQKQHLWQVEFLQLNFCFFFFFPTEEHVYFETLTLGDSWAMVAPRNLNKLNAWGFLLKFTIISSLLSVFSSRPHQAASYSTSLLHADFPYSVWGQSTNSAIYKLQEPDRGVFCSAILGVQGEEQWGEYTSLCVGHEFSQCHWLLPEIYLTDSSRNRELGYFGLEEC